LAKSNGDLFGDGTHPRSNRWQRLGELVGQGRNNATYALPCLVEVALSECSQSQQLEDVAIDLRSNGFEDIECERVSVRCVRVPNADARIKTEGRQHQRTLQLTRAVEIIEQRVRGVDGTPVPTSDG
jgi:hypothetical protein